MKIKLSLIDAAPYRVRELEDEDKLDRLRGSIEREGLLHPPLVRELDGRYEIVDGHRRVAAARLAGWREIDAIVSEHGGDPVLLALVANVNREDMKPVDVAHSLAEIKTRTGWSNKHLGISLGKDESTIRTYLRILEDPDIEEIVGAYDLTPDHVSKVWSAPPEERPEILLRAGKRGLSVSQTKLLADQYRNSRIQRSRPAVEPLQTYWSWPKDKRVVAIEDKLKGLAPGLESLMIDKDNDPMGLKLILSGTRNKLNELAQKADELIGNL